MHTVLNVFRFGDGTGLLSANGMDRWAWLQTIGMVAVCSDWSPAYFQGLRCHGFGPWLGGGGLSVVLVDTDTVFGNQCGPIFAMKSAGLKYSIVRLPLFIDNLFESSSLVNLLRWFRCCTLLLVMGLVCSFAMVVPILLR
jgi:hypothetical protein